MALKNKMERLIGIISRVDDDDDAVVVENDQNVVVASVDDVEYCCFLTIVQATYYIIKLI